MNLRLALRCAALAAFTALCVPVAGGTGEPATGPSGRTKDELAGFGTSLQAAVRSNAPERVANLVVFPIRVNGPRKGQVRHFSRIAFLAHYDTIFTPYVKNVVLRQSVTDFSESWRGIMFGDGTVWAAGVCRDKSCAKVNFGVVAINLQAQ